MENLPAGCVEEKAAMRTAELTSEQPTEQHEDLAGESLDKGRVDCSPSTGVGESEQLAGLRTGQALFVRRTIWKAST